MEVREASAAYLTQQNVPVCLAGYKQTEVGMIPEDWGVTNLGRLISSLEAGVSVNSVDKDKDTYPHDESILKTSAVFGGVFKPDEYKKIVPRDLSRAKLNPRKDSIIISRMNTPALVGECGYVDRDYPVLFLPDRLWMTRHNVEHPPCVRWLAYLLSFSAFNRSIKESATGTSGSMKNISKGSLLTIQVPHPTEDEQEAIARALSDTDALIESLEQLIAKKRHIKQGAMQELLTGKRRLPGFEQKPGDQETEMGVIPVDWRLDYVKNHAQITTGGKNTQDRVENGAYPFFVRSQTVERINSYSYDGEAVLTAGDGVGTGKVFHYINGKFDTHQRVYRITDFSNELNGYYFYLYFSNNFYDRIIQMTAKSSVDSVRMEMIADMLIPLPPTKAEQEAIAETLSNMNSEITSLETQLAKTRQLKQGMMHELLTGRIRLVKPTKDKGK